MNGVRKLFLAAGTVLAGVTLLVLTVPAVGNAIPIGTVVEQLGGDWVLVAVFGGVAAVFLLSSLAWRGVEGLDQTDPPTPEEVETVPRFGGDFDDLVDQRFGIRDRFFSDRPAAVREHVREAAVDAEMAATGCSRAEAERRVADGSWTTDAEAAAFLADDTDPPVSARVQAAVRGRAWFQRGARRAAAAACDRAGVGGER